MRAAEALRVRDPDWILPPLWRHEWLNTLRTSVRGGVITGDIAAERWREGVVRFGPCERDPDYELALRLGIESGCSAYDGQYVALARGLGVRLVTDDRQILRRFPRDAVALAGS